MCLPVQSFQLWCVSLGSQEVRTANVEAETCFLRINPDSRWACVVHVIGRSMFGSSSSSSEELYRRSGNQLRSARNLKQPCSLSMLCMLS